MDKDVGGLLAKYFAERADRPFGDVEALSGRTLQPFSLAGQQAATNLLDKAHRALEEGQPDRARGFIDRAVALQFDTHEQVAPAAVAAHMELFCLITDSLEASAEGESRWLDVAIDVLAIADESSQCDIRDVLTAIDHDYALPSPERTRLQAAVVAVPVRAELRDLRLAPTELGDQVMSILTTCQRYRAALETPAS